MYRYSSFILTVLLLWMWAWSQPVSAGMNVPLSEASSESLAAYSSVVNDFNLLKSFFNDADWINSQPISEHAHNPQEALAYLQSGFDLSLATLICNYYTSYDSGSHHVILLNQDGFPFLSMDDNRRIHCNKPAPGVIVFSREYSGCYVPGDRYLFTVRAVYTDSTWKISDLKLEVITSSIMSR